jgi:hypothetical protein
MTPRLLLQSFVQGPAEDLKDPLAAAASTAKTFAKDSILGAWQACQREVDREFGERERAGLSVDAAPLLEGLMGALSFCEAIVTQASHDRDRSILSVQMPGHTLVVLIMTGMHHASVASSLGRAHDLAKISKVVVVREIAHELPSSWTAVQERRRAFEAMPNARWLWLDGNEVRKLLALGLLLSRARAGRVHSAKTKSVAASTVAELRAEIERLLAPAQWISTEDIVRCLSDVPRSFESVPQAPKTRRTASSTASNKLETPEAIDPRADSALPTVREWLSVGKRLGKRILNDARNRISRGR